MRFQDIDSEFAVLQFIALVAIVVFIIMLILVFTILRSEFKPTPPDPRKDEREHPLAAAESPVPLPQAERATLVPPAAENESSLPAEGFPPLLSGARRTDSGVPGLMAILGQFRHRIQTLNWLICILVAVLAAWLNYSRLPADMERISLHSNFVWLGILSPISFGIAWLRLTGSPWRQAFLLFIFVPVAFGALLFTLLIAEFIAHIFGYS